MHCLLERVGQLLHMRFDGEQTADDAHGEHTTKHNVRPLNIVVFALNYIKTKLDYLLKCLFVKLNGFLNYRINSENT